VYLARTGEAKKAASDAARVLREEPTPFRLYQMAGVYAQLSRWDQTGGMKQYALQLLAKAFRSGFENFKLLDKDPDLDPIREDKEFQDLVGHARKLQVVKQ
jgi:hypothetical protein